MNIYEVFDQNDISLHYFVESAAAARKDFECSRPNDHIKRIRRVL